MLYIKRYACSVFERFYKKEINHVLNLEEGYRNSDPINVLLRYFNSEPFPNSSTSLKYKIVL